RQAAMIPETVRRAMGSPSHCPPTRRPPVALPRPIERGRDGQAERRRGSRACRREGRTATPVLRSAPRMDTRRACGRRARPLSGRWTAAANRAWSASVRVTPRAARRSAHATQPAVSTVTTTGGTSQSRISTAPTIRPARAGAREARRVDPSGREYRGAMTDSEGNEPENPFKGTPFEQLFGGLAGGPGGQGMPDLSGLMGQLQAMMTPFDGPVNWELGRDTARKTVAQHPDPSPSSRDRDQVADALRLADHWLDETTVFASGVRTTPAWSRAEWIEQTLPVWKVLVEPVAEHVSAALAN